MTNNIWLFPSEGLLFIKDIDPHGGSGGCCMEVALGESNVNYVCRKDKPIKCSAEECLKIQKETGTKYIFNKIETSGSEITSYITTV